MNTGLPPNGNPKNQDKISLLWQSFDALTGHFYYKNNNKPNINCMNNLFIIPQEKMNLRTLYFVFLLFTSFLIHGQAIQSSTKKICKSELEIVDGNNKKETNNIGTSYRLALKNNGNEPLLYTIRIQSPAFDRKNSNIKNSNTRLKTNFFEYKTNTSKRFDLVKKSDNKYQVRIAPNEVFTFIIELIVPKQVNNGAMNITEVTVTADKCKDGSVKTVLYTTVNKSSVTKQF